MTVFEVAVVEQPMRMSPSYRKLRIVALIIILLIFVYGYLYFDEKAYDIDVHHLLSPFIRGDITPQITPTTSAASVTNTTNTTAGAACTITTTATANTPADTTSTTTITTTTTRKSSTSTATSLSNHLDTITITTTTTIANGAATTTTTKTIILSSMSTTTIKTTTTTSRRTAFTTSITALPYDNSTIKYTTTAAELSKPSNSESRNAELSPVDANKTEDYLIDNPGCQIPKLDPYHPTVKHLIKHLVDLNCHERSILFVENYTLRINNSTVSDETECFVQPITRKTEHKSKLGTAVRIKNGKVTVTSEFVTVKCKKANETIYEQFYPFVFRKEDVEKRILTYTQRKKHQEREKLRILMLGLESASRNQFLRHLRRTHKFIKQNFTFIDLQGYNKLGKNTYPNMAPLLTGKLEDELPNLSKEYSDVLPLIWKEFMENGYTSQYSEDAPSISAFNYAKRGFDKVPADYYLRPWSLIAETHKGKTGCIGDRVEAEVILKYVEDFFDMFPNDPLFSFMFLSRLSHDYINRLSYHDKPIRNFFERLHLKGHLNNTILFFFGDHGFRYGDLRFTYVGRMEGRSPFMFIIVPAWFPKKYPQLYKNLKTNERRLSTPLDIHATLKDILYFDGKGFEDEGTGRNISLMKHIIPTNRTCEDANIETQWCACVRSKPVPLNDTKVKTAASEIVKKINFITEKERMKCSNVSLVSIFSASKQDVELGENSTHDGYTNYLISLKVSPSDGIFEGSVWFNGNDSYSVDNTIERMNLYRNQSACVNQTLLKPYCYCRD